MGFVAISLSTLLMFMVRLALTLFCIERSEKLKNIYGVELFSKESTQQINEQFKMGCYGLLMGVWMWWAFDIFTLVASYLSISEISAQAILRALGLMTFMIPVGFQLACSILVGKSIGEGSITAIKQYYKLCMIVSVCIAFL